RLARHLDEAVLPVPLVLDVVDRAPALDLTHLGEERRELVRDVVPLDAMRVADDLGRFLAAAGAEVREEASTHAHGLPHVEHLPRGPDHPIDAGAVTGVLPYVVAEFRCATHGRLLQLRLPRGPAVAGLLLLLAVGAVERGAVADHRPLDRRAAH